MADFDAREIQPFATGELAERDAKKLRPFATTFGPTKPTATVRASANPPDETIGGSGVGPQSFGPGGPGAKRKASGADRQTGPETSGQDD
ncbi:MAG TPA: hypothetical protein VFA43_26620 [Gemmatimonadaceae bacterium]|nr:hypothetical protein [Gemmatimonadaceae bacterium]